MHVTFKALKPFLCVLHCTTTWHQPGLSRGLVDTRKETQTDKQTEDGLGGGLPNPPILENPDVQLLQSTVLSPPPPYLT